MVVILYTLQGVVLGLVSALPLYAASLNATWKDQGTLSFASYPLIAKLFWAPLIDVWYVRRLGRRLTWLLPTQLLLGVILIALSFYLEAFLLQLRVLTVTCIFFVIVFLIATQDICVDGWALTLFASSAIAWQATAQMIGQPLGNFLGLSFLLTFESANVTNRWIRQPLNMPAQPFGLFTLGQFVRFWGAMFLVISCLVIVLFTTRQQRRNSNVDDHGQEHARPTLTLRETYLYVVKLFKKKNFRQFLFILVASHVAFAATSAMTYVTLIK